MHYIAIKETNYGVNCSKNVSETAHWRWFLVQFQHRVPQTLYKIHMDSIRIELNIG